MVQPVIQQLPTPDENIVDKNFGMANSTLKYKMAMNNA